MDRPKPEEMLEKMPKFWVKCIFSKKSDDLLVWVFSFTSFGASSQDEGNKNKLSIIRRQASVLLKLTLKAGDWDVGRRWGWGGDFQLLAQFYLVERC